MSQDMDWSPTFCLACDIQTDGNAYCGEACRLAEYERANTGSEASSPASHQGSISWPARQSNTFYLPSAYDFTKKASSTSSRPRPQSQPIYARPALTPSSSQSSLFSMQSTSSTSSSTEQVQLSEETRRELRGYASCFDQSRYHRRHSAH